jgi:hypothetical protein
MGCSLAKINQAGIVQDYIKTKRKNNHNGFAQAKGRNL